MAPRSHVPPELCGHPNSAATPRVSLLPPPQLYHGNTGGQKSSITAVFLVSKPSNSEFSSELERTSSLELAPGLRCQPRTAQILFLTYLPSALNRVCRFLTAHLCRIRGFFSISHTHMLAGWSLMQFTDHISIQTSPVLEYWSQQQQRLCPSPQP